MPSLDFFILILFLALNLIIGLWYGRKVKSLKDYALGGKNFSTAVLTATILATAFGGGFLFMTLENIYKYGLCYSIVEMAVPISSLLIGQVLIIRMGEFFKNLSIAEVMGDLYGRAVRIITALCGIIVSVGAIAIQFKVIAKLLLLLGLKKEFTALLAAIIVIAYSAFGGVRAVTFTDVFQFLIFSLFIPMLIWRIWQDIRNPDQVVYILTKHPDFSFASMGWNHKFVSFLILALVIMIPRISPPTLQRIVMADSVAQSKRSFVYASLIGMLLVISVCSVGILLLASDASLAPEALFKHIIDTYSSPGITGFFCIGVLSLTMSTADSHLNAAAVLFTNDILKPLKQTFKNEVKVTRLLSFALGIFALLLAVRIHDILQLFLTVAGFYAPIISIPLLLAIFGFRSTTKAVLTGMAAGLVTVVAWKHLHFLTDTGINSVMPGMLANMIALVGSHYLFFKQENTGWVGVKDDSYLKDAQQKRQWMWQHFIAAVKNFSLYTYLQKHLAKSNRIYFFFGLYVLTVAYSLFYHSPLSATISTQDSLLWNSVLVSLLVAGSYFLLQALFARFFNLQGFTIGILCLFMPVFFAVSCMICMVCDCKMLFISNFVLTLLMTTLPITFVMAGSGVLLAVVLSLLGHFSLAQLIISQFGIYQTFLFGIVIACLVWYKQYKKQLEAKYQYVKATQEAYNQDQLHTLQYQGYFKRALEGSGKAEPLALAKKALTKFGEKVPVEKETAQKAIDQIEAFVAHYKNTFYHTMDFLKLQVREISLEDLLDKLYRILDKEGMQEQVLFQVQTQQKNLACDPDKITQLLATSIRTLHGSSIHLQVQDTQLAYQFKAVPSQTRTLAALAFTLTTDNKVATPKTYYQGNTKEPAITIPANLSQLLQRENERIIDAHYGYSQSKDSLILHVIPVKLRDIRPKVVDEPPTATQDAPLDNKASLAAEKALLGQLAAQTKLAPSLAQEVLGYIKQIHQGQLRKSGDLFYTHPMTVASLLLGLTQDPDAIVAALLHDAVEDTLVTLEEVQYKYGKTVAFIVGKVTHLDQTFKKAKLTERENQLQLAAQQDPRIIMVKLADRLHNVRTMQFHPSFDKQKKIAQETLDFYVPLGRMLGLPAVDKVVDEIEEHCQALLAKDELDFSQS